VYFHDRAEAGRFLAQHLLPYKGTANVLVLGLPRGGVVVAYEVALELNAPLDIFVVRKLGVPGQEELAMGALATGAIRVLNDSIIREFGLSSATVDLVTANEQKELERRELLYRGERQAGMIKDHSVIVVDDGLATGSTMKAAVVTLRQKEPKRIVVAVPTGPAETCEELRKIADEVVCGLTPQPFYAVGGSYVDFRQTTDEEVRELISRSSRQAA